MFRRPKRTWTRIQTRLGSGSSPPEPRNTSRFWHLRSEVGPPGAESSGLVTDLHPEHWRSGGRGPGGRGCGGHGAAVDSRRNRLWTLGGRSWAAGPGPTQSQQKTWWQFLQRLWRREDPGPPTVTLQALPWSSGGTHCLHKGDGVSGGSGVSSCWSRLGHAHGLELSSALWTGWETGRTTLHSGGLRSL